MRGGTSSSIRPIELMDRHAASLLDESAEEDKEYTLAMQHQEAAAPMPSGMSGVSIRVFGVDSDYPDARPEGKSPTTTNGKFTTLVDSRSLAFPSAAPGKSRLNGGSPPILGGGGGPTKAAPPPTPSFPFSFSEDLLGLEDEPLPVRLGLAPPSSPFTGPPPAYYLCNPPPQRRPSTPPSPTSRRKRDASGLTGPDLSEFMSASDQASTSAYTLDTPSPSFIPRHHGTPGMHGPRVSEDWSDPNRTWNPEEYFRHEQVYLRGRTRIRKWHGYSATQAPWYYSYDPEVTQSDQLLHGVTTCALQRPSLTPFTPGHQPARVLDVGCGVGHWTIDTALKWKDTEFIGMDLVPIQTPVAVMDNEDLSKRVSWVVANFLEEWPFPDGSFDFVNLRYIEAGVPETMWDHVLSEAVRVAAPGACIEVIVAAMPFLGNSYLLSQGDLDAMSVGKLDKFNVPAGDGGVQVPKNQSYEAIKIVYAKMDNRR